MDRILKVNFGEIQDEAHLIGYLNFIKRNKNNITFIINNKKIDKKIKNIFLPKKIKVKIKILDYPFNYQEYRMKYNIYDIKNEKKEIRILGQEFVSTNHPNCLILYENKAFSLREYFSIENNINNYLIIKLLSFENISDFSHMFDNCHYLEKFEFYLKDEDDIIKENENSSEDDNIYKINSLGISFEDNNMSEELYSSGDEKYYKFYWEEKGDKYLNIISLISYKSESDSFSLFKESNSAEGNIKDFNKFPNYKNKNNAIISNIISDTFSRCLLLKLLLIMLSVWIICFLNAFP